jgi:hypothetical protein
MDQDRIGGRIEIRGLSPAEDELLVAGVVERWVATDSPILADEEVVAGAVEFIPVNLPPVYSLY